MRIFWWKFRWFPLWVWGWCEVGCFVGKAPCKVPPPRCTQEYPDLFLIIKQKIYISPLTIWFHLERYLDKVIDWIKSKCCFGDQAKRSLQKQKAFPWDFYESKKPFVEISTKARSLSLWSLRKQEAFHWNLYENKKPFALKSLRKQEASPWDLNESKKPLRWNFYESKKPFLEISTKARSLSLRFLRKHEAFRWDLYESKKPFLEISTKAFSKA